MRSIANDMTAEAPLPEYPVLDSPIPIRAIGLPASGGLDTLLSSDEAYMAASAGMSITAFLTTLRETLYTKRKTKTKTAKARYTAIPTVFLGY